MVTSQTGDNPERNVCVRVCLKIAVKDAAVVHPHAGAHWLAFPYPLLILAQLALSRAGLLLIVLV